MSDYEEKIDEKLTDMTKETAEIATYEVRASLKARNIPIIGYNTILGKIDLDLKVLITGRQLRDKSEFVNKFTNVKHKGSFLRRMVSMKHKQNKKKTRLTTLLLAGRQRFDLNGIQIESMVDSRVNRKVRSNLRNRLEKYSLRMGPQR